MGCIYYFEMVNRVLPSDSCSVAMCAESVSHDGWRNITEAGFLVSFRSILNLIKLVNGMDLRAG